MTIIKNHWYSHDKKGIVRTDIEKVWETQFHSTCDRRIEIEFKYTDQFEFIIPPNGYIEIYAE